MNNTEFNADKELLLTLYFQNILLFSSENYKNIENIFIDLSRTHSKNELIDFFDDFGNFCHNCKNLDIYYNGDIPLFSNKDGIEKIISEILYSGPHAIKNKNNDDLFVFTANNFKFFNPKDLFANSKLSDVSENQKSILSSAFQRYTSFNYRYKKYTKNDNSNSDDNIHQA